MFFGKTCPRCVEAEEFLLEAVKEHPEINLHLYEVYYNRRNSKLFEDFCAAYGIEKTGVPTTFIGDRVIVGYSDKFADSLRDALQNVFDGGGPDPHRIYIRYMLTGQQAMQSEPAVVPMLGDVSDLSLPLVSVAMGLLDGFNPCAFFVLLFLLSILAQAQSRGKMLLIGGIFIGVSGILYFLFMAAWLNFFALAGTVGIITVVAGIAAIVIGTLNTKDFFFNGRGASLSLPEQKRSRLVGRMRALLHNHSIPSMIGATIILAGSANLYELFCTAGFPLVFTRILTLQQLPSLTHYLYLGLYTLAYILPFVAIVLASVLTLGARKLSESAGRTLKLLSGLLMLSLGITLLFFPSVLDKLYIAAFILAADTVIALVLAAFTRRVKSKRRNLIL